MKTYRNWTIACFLWVLLFSTPASGQLYSHLKSGDDAPDFRTRLLDGSKIRLKDLRGKVVVLNFWFIACPPCMVEIPELNRLVDHFAGKPVVFLGLTPDLKGELREFLESKEFKYAIVPESTPVADRFGVQTAPVHIVIDPKGKIDSILYGAVSDLETQLVKPIESLLADAAG